MTRLSLRSDGTGEAAAARTKGLAALAVLFLALVAALGFVRQRVRQRMAALEGRVAVLSAELEQSRDLARQAADRAAAAEAASQAAAEGRQLAEARSADAQQRAGTARQEADVARAEASTAREIAAQAQSERVRKKAEAEVGLLEAALGQIGETRRTALGLVMNLGSEYLKFEFDKAELRPEDRDLLSRIAGILMTSHDYTVSVNGHTDDVGTDAYNQKLSERRAQAVRDYLVKACSRRRS